MPMPRLLTLLIFAGCAAWAAQIDDFEWRGPIARGRLVEIRGINGDIHALPSTSGEVEVVARVANEDGDAEPVQVQLVPGDGGLTICATRPGQTECQPVEQSSTQGPGARVDFFVRVPEGVGFRGRTVNGAVEAESLRSDVEAYTVNGQVRISTTGSAQARTVNGSITASLLNPFWHKAPQFSTVNGGITLNLPARLNTFLRAETRNGKVLTDFASLRGRITDQRIEGRIGAGSAVTPLVIHAINGTIQIKRTL
jgi:hypothetical protein